MTPPPETPGQAAHADGDTHAHRAPHGGAIATAGSGHLEAILGDRTLTIYVLDAGEATMPIESVASWEAVVEPPGGAARAITLRPLGDVLVGALPDGLSEYTATVTVRVGGEVRTARFAVSAAGTIAATG